MSRPLGDIRPPGVYVSNVDAPNRGYTLADTRIAGFVGMAAKGPLDEPTRISSWDQFCDVYSNADIGHLSNAVEGFFLNGGHTCYGVPVAPPARNGAGISAGAALPAGGVAQEA